MRRPFRRLLNRDVRTGLLAGAAYLAVSLLWIVLTDGLVREIAAGPDETLRYQTIKGGFFVLVMAVIIGVVAYVITRQNETATEILDALRTDPITRLPSRRAAIDLMERRLRRGDSFSLLLLNIRRFGRLNAALGRSGGDAVLEQVARRLIGIGQPEELIAHMDADEYLVVLPGPSRRDAMERLAEIARSFEEPISLPEADIVIELASGYARARRDGVTVPQLLDVCHRRLESTKQASGSSVVTGWSDVPTSAGDLRLEGELRQAIRAGQFEVVLQPQFRTGNLDIVGAEALVRWRHPSLGLVEPKDFIPLAESLGVVVDITEQVLNQSIAQWNDWRMRGFATGRLSVNLSGIDFDSERILSVVAAVREKYRLPGATLTFEISETWFAKSHQTALLIVQALQSQDICVALDDFGQGQSSLAQLLRFEVDQLKVDRAFVTGSAGIAEKVAMLTAIQRMAGALHMETVAEGVETEEDFRLIKRLGFDVAQGFLLGRPMAPDEFEQTFLGERSGEVLADMKARLLGHA